MGVDFSSFKPEKELLAELHSRFGDEDIFVAEYGGALGKSLVVTGPDSLMTFKGTRNLKRPDFELQRTEIKQVGFKAPSTGAHVTVEIESHDGKRRSLATMDRHDALRVVSLLDFESARNLAAGAPQLDERSSGLKGFAAARNTADSVRSELAARMAASSSGPSPELTGQVTASARLLVRGSGIPKLTKITVYQKGFVTVGMKPPEKLLSISMSESTNTKTALGRGAAAVVTFGVNLYASKLRGQAYLTIGTDLTTYSMHIESPQPSEVRDLQKLVVAGEAAISARSAGNVPTVISESATRSRDFAGQLAQLAALHDQGALTDEEFAAAKSKLIT